MLFFRKKYLYEVKIRCNDKIEQFMFESNDNKHVTMNLIKKVYSCLYKKDENDIDVIIRKASLKEKTKYYMEEDIYE